MGRVLFNDAAGNLLSGISGGLRCEIIGIFVDNDGFADDLAYRKPVCQKHCESVAAVAPQRRQVSRMIGVLAAVRIVVRQRECFPAPFRCYRMTQARKVSGETM